MAETQAKIIQEKLADFKRKLQKLYGERLKHIILYGLWARGEATVASDIDLLIVLKGQVNPGQEIDRLIDTVTDFNLEHNELLSIYPLSEETYTTVSSPLLINVRREGVPI